MWGIIPAAGAGSRIQPLAFSKELLPVGSRREGELERPRAVSEYLVDRMVRGGVRKICFVISPEKSDILSYYGGEAPPARIFYAVQSRPAGLCDAIFQAAPLVHSEEQAIVGLPDTVWFPGDALCRLEDHRFSFLLFPVDHPERFDAVLIDGANRVLEVRVKRRDAGSRWIWGAFKFPGSVLHALHELWRERGGVDEYFGSLVNAFIERGGVAHGVCAGESYVDVGTLSGFREAAVLLENEGAVPGQR